jgi:carbon monoxide dehydrogenase subunit G
MRIEGRHELAASRDQVWAALHDPAILAGTLPGARRLEATGEDEYALTVDVGVGSVKGTYEGTFALTDQEPPDACTITARASGLPGSVETVARVRLTEQGAGVLLGYEADATVTGPLAGVGQRLVAGAARRNTERFLSALDRAIAAPPEAAATGHEIAAPVPRPGADPRWIVAGAVAGAAAALLGVAVGRWTMRR